MPRHGDYRPGMTEDELAPIRLTEAQRELAAQNFGLVFTAANHYHDRTGVDRDDLICRFSESLVYAARCWPPDGPYAFSTFAWRWFKQAIGARSRGRLIKVPLSAHQRRNTKDRALATLAMVRVQDDSDEQDMLDTMPAPEPDQPANFDDMSELRDALDGLSPLRFAAVTEMVMGEMSQGAFGEQHGRSRYWAGEVQRRAVEALRERVGR